MLAVSLIAVGQLKGQTAPYSLASITGTVYDSVGTAITIPTPKSLVFFRGKTFTAPGNSIYFSLPFACYLTENNKTLITVNDGNNPSVHLTGGNTTPFYISVRYPRDEFQFIININRVNYGNAGNFDVYFPYGLISGSMQFFPYNNPGTLMAYIGNTPYDNLGYRVCQDANGNEISCP